MLRQCSLHRTLNSWQRTVYHTPHKISTSARASFQGPNAPLDLDPSLQELLKDVDMSMMSYRTQKKRPSSTNPSVRELEVLEFDQSWEQKGVDFDAPEDVGKQRKSERAAFGSQGIGSVFLPADLRDAIESVIREHDRPGVREDAKRLFLTEKGGMNMWDTVYDPQYRSRKQAARHADTDGTAFASIALPAHYSAIYAVLDNLRHRLGSDWEIRHVLEWGSGVGSGIWASTHAFQQLTHVKDNDPLTGNLASRSTIQSYLNIEKRDGLSSMAKQLLKNVDMGATQVSWRRGFSETDQINRSGGSDTLALSAFYLSSLPTPLARKELIKQIWSSGANAIVLIDHDSPSGFESIAEAREYLLRMGKRELDDPNTQSDGFNGCHVVAPCPHDGACPLRHSGPSKLVCSFSQRLQRPSFLRKAKNVRAGHEDIGYTYVVIKRGPRPAVPSLDGDSPDANSVSEADSEGLIRMEAYNWPRLVFPPLKKSGHVILDGCTKEGQIMRMTIPRSQGKQPYYDARKSSWGDIFPHDPKNPPQVRFQSSAKDKSEGSELPGSDIGKRKNKAQRKQVTSYDKITADLKESKKQRRREYSAKIEDID